MTPARLLGALSLLFLALRVYAATRVGFGDAEALYVVYGLHPQPIYLDHPGLVGTVARLVGGAGAPTPQRLHALTAVASTLVPYVAWLAARLLGARREQAPLAGLALVAAPEITVGLFALTPDLLLAPLWLLGAGAFGLALRSPPGSAAALVGLLAAGACAGLGFTAKVPAALLAAAMGAALLSSPGRPHLRTAAPWLAALLWAILAAPVALAEARAGFPMLHHRLVSTQQQSGLSLRNLGALVGGQLGYLSPLVCVAGWFVLRALWRRVETRRRDVCPGLQGDQALPAQGSSRSGPGAPLVQAHLGGLDRPDVRDTCPGAGFQPGAWLLLLAVVSGLPLGALCLWSRVAEPHWLAPAWLAVALALPLAPEAVPRRLGRWALGTGVALSLLVHGWTLTDLAPRWMGRWYEARYDLANDLHTWPGVRPALLSLIAQTEHHLGERPGIVAPHWIVAAQVEATLGGTYPITTLGEIPDDFQRWAGERGPGSVVLWVSDDRFDLAPTGALREAPVLASLVLEMNRGGRVVRRVRVALLSLGVTPG